MARRTKRSATSKRVLVILALFLLAFIISMIVTFWVKGSVPDTLISCVLDASKIEAMALGAIKISKVWRGENNV